MERSGPENWMSGSGTLKKYGGAEQERSRSGAGAERERSGSGAGAER